MPRRTWQPNRFALPNVALRNKIAYIHPVREDLNLIPVNGRFDAETIAAAKLVAKRSDPPAKWQAVLRKFARDGAMAALKEMGSGTTI